jgi:hypothetical protein
MSTDNNKTIEEFSRFEFKYILNAGLRDQVETQIQHFMKYDGYVHPEFDNSYFVRSLYFDSPKSFNFYEKIDGIKKRKKFRLRTYDKKPGNSSLFIEQKGRNVNRVFKHRTLIEQDHLNFFYDGMNFEKLVINYRDMNIINEFISDTVKRKIEPVVLVDYMRRPYISDYDMNFRVTFDSHIKAKASQTLFPDTNNSFDCLSGYTILEVKFFRKIPAWFHKLVLVYNLDRVSVSKFVLGMKACGIATDLS